MSLNTPAQVCLSCEDGLEVMSDPKEHSLEIVVYWSVEKTEFNSNFRSPNCGAVILNNSKSILLVILIIPLFQEPFRTLLEYN